MKNMYICFTKYECSFAHNNKKQSSDKEPGDAGALPLAEVGDGAKQQVVGDDAKQPPDGMRD